MAQTSGQTSDLSQPGRQPGAWADDDGFRARFATFFQRYRAALDVPLSVIAASIGKTERTIRLWLEGKGKAGPSFQDIEAIDGVFSALGLDGFQDSIRLKSRIWQVQALHASAAAALPEYELLALGLRQTSLDPLEYLRQKGLDEKVHILELDEGDHLRIRHIGRAIPLKLGPEVLHKDLRELSDPEFGCILHRQMMAIAASGRDVFHQLVSERVTYSRMAMPLNRGRRPGNVRRVAALPFDFKMSVDRFALD